VEAAKYPMLLVRSRFHLGIPLAFFAVAIIWFINEKVVFGYQSRAVGVNIKAAHFGGINTTSVILRTAIISGGLAGVGELCAIQYRLIMDISPGYGYSGIVIAMLGNLQPLGVLFSSLFFSVIIVRRSDYEPDDRCAILYCRGDPGDGLDGDACLSAFD